MNRKHQNLIVNNLQVNDPTRWKHF